VPVEEDGTFRVDAVLQSERAARIMIGPAEVKSDECRKFFTLTGAQFREMIRIGFGDRRGWGLAAMASFPALPQRQCQTLPSVSACAR